MTQNVQRETNNKRSGRTNRTIAMSISPRGLELRKASPSINTAATFKRM